MPNGVRGCGTQVVSSIKVIKKTHISTNPCRGALKGPSTFFLFPEARVQNFSLHYVFIPDITKHYEWVIFQLLLLNK